MASALARLGRNFRSSLTQPPQNDEKVNGEMKDVEDAAVEYSDVSEGPDLNSSKSPPDKKHYRQIILAENGLRVVLISDTVAMGQSHLRGEGMVPEPTEGGDYEEYGDGGDDGDGDGDGDGFDDGDEREDGDSDDLMDEDGDDDDEDDSDADEDADKFAAQEEAEKKAAVLADENEDDDDDDEDGEDGELEDEIDGLREAAAAMVVDVGSYSDPVLAQGLAHFLEHMLFMGTTKFPTENAYDAFLSKSGGSNNAYTEMEHTVFTFEVPQERLFEALDMFAQFFISPLLLEDAVERELQAIESEFQLSKNSDECRLQQLVCHTCGKSIDEHPFAKFSWGDLRSLRDIPEEKGCDVMKELRSFYSKHYFGSKMSLVVCGAYSLDELQDKVVQYFSAVPAQPTSIPEAKEAEKETPVRTWDSLGKLAEAGLVSDNGSKETPTALPLAPASLQRLFRMVPIKDRHSLSLTWQVPTQSPHWKSKPCDYIAHLLGHEASGSLLAAMKAKSWANACYAGVGSSGVENASSHALFSIAFTLSEEGVAHWVEIVELVYVYMGMIRWYCQSEDGLPTWIYEELRRVQEISYQFEDEVTPIELVESMVEDLGRPRVLPPEHLLDGNALLFEFDGKTVKDLVDNYLIVENSRVDIMSSLFQGHANGTTKESEDAVHPALTLSKADIQTEPMFGTEYWSHAIPDEFLKRWKTAGEPQMPPEDSDIQLPPKNPFLPETLELKPLPEEPTPHPILSCCLEVSFGVGEDQKPWVPATVLQYKEDTNKVLLLFRDGKERWCRIDLSPEEATEKLKVKFTGTFDNEEAQYKVTSVSNDMGDPGANKDSEDQPPYHDDGSTFPPIPSALPSTRLPQMITDSNALRLWHLQDRKFKRPTSELRLQIVGAEANKTPLDRACADLFVVLVSDAVTEMSYLASVARLGSVFGVSDIGFHLRVYGFSDKVLPLTKELLSVFASFMVVDDSLPSCIKPGRFEACLELLMRRYGNHGMQASKLCTDVRLRCIRPTIWSADAKAKSMQGLTVAVFRQTVAAILKRIAIEAFYHGNVTVADAEEAKALIETQLLSLAGAEGIPRDERPAQLVIQTPLSTAGHKVVVAAKDPNEPNTAVEMYIQIGKDELQQRVMIDLLSQVLYEPMFDQLRTKDQIGYSVSCGARWSYGVMGIDFKVVTTTLSADAVRDRIDEFLQEYRKTVLAEMTDEEFMEHVVGLAKIKLQMYNSLEEECNALWSEICEGRYEWQIYRKEALRLRSVTKLMLAEAFDTWLLPRTMGEFGQARERRGLVVQVIGTSEGPASMRRPEWPNDAVGAKIDHQVETFHATVHHQTWGPMVWN